MKYKKSIISVSAIFAILLIIVATIFSMLAGISEYFIRDWLKGKGIDSRVDITKVDLFNGIFELRSFQIEPENKQNARLGKLYIKINPEDVWNNKLTIEMVKLNGLHLDVSQVIGGITRFGGINPDNFIKTTDSNKQSSQGNWSISVKDLVLENIDTCYHLSDKNKNVLQDKCLKVNKIEFKGNSSILANFDGQSNKITTSLTLQIDKINLYSGSGGSNLITIGSLSVEDLKINQPDSRSIKYLIATNLAIAGNNHVNKLSMDSIAVHDLNVDSLLNMNISSVKANGLSGALLREKNGQLAIIQYLESQFKLSDNQQDIKDTDATKPKNSKATTPQIKIGEFTLDNNSQLTVIDKSVSPEFNERITQIKLNIKDINTTDKSSRQKVAMSVLMEGYGELHLTGTTTLLTEKASSDLKATIKNLDLAPLSGYLKQAMVYKIKSGQLDANIDFKAENGMLDSKVNLNLKKFYVNELNAEDAKEYKSKYGMLLPAALSLLREKDDSINISFPVTGNLSDPKFSFASEITKLSRDAIKSAVITYYTPFGMISAAKSAFDIVTALRFPSLTYKPGKFILTDNNKKSLEKLIKLLKEKPYVHISLCGIPTLKDRLAKFPDEEVQDAVNQYGEDQYSEDSDTHTNLDSVLPEIVDSQKSILLNIARKRQEGVRSYLQSNGIEPERMILCNPDYSNNNTGEPRVEFYL